MVYEVEMSTNGTNKPMQTDAQKVGLWHERISTAKKNHDDWVASSGAKRFCDEYKGKFPQELSFVGWRGNSINIPPVNDVFSYVQTDIASTYNRDPYISVNAKAGTTQGAKIQEVWLNYQWRELKIKEEIELEIIDKDLVGYAFHKVGNTVTSVGTGDQTKILKEELYSMRVDWRDIFWNVGARRPPKDCQWMAQRLVRPLEDIKKKYPNAKTMTGTCHPDIDEKTYQSSLYKDDIEVGIYYEIWDARDRMIYRIGEGLRDVFLDDPTPWPDYLDEFPFIMYWDFAIPGEPRPLSAIAPQEPQIFEKMVLLAQALNHAKRWNRQMIVNNGAMDDQTLDKYERGDDGAILVNQGTGNLNENVKTLDFGALPTDFYLLMDRIDAIKRETVGQSEVDRGGVTKTGSRTIGELQLIAKGSQGRTDRRIDRLETHIENVARQMLANMKANFDFEKVLKVTGGTPEEVIAALGDKYDPVTQTVTFTADDIQGEYDVECKAGSTLPLNKEMKMQIFEQVLAVMGQLGPEGSGDPMVVAIITEMLDGFDIKSLKEAYAAKQQSDAQAAQANAAAQEAEDQKTKAEAAKRIAQTDQISQETDIMVDQAHNELPNPELIKAHAEAHKALNPPEPKSNGAKK